MAKLKKSIKAIIISICAVVVLAGSIVGAVFANKNKGSGDDKTTNPPTQQQTPTGPSTPTTPVVPEISFVDSQKDLVDTINSSNTKIDTVEKIDNRLIEESGFDIDEIKAINSKYFVVKSNSGIDVYLYAKTETEDYKITPLEEFVDIDVEYESFAVYKVQDEYIMYSYKYELDYQTYQVFKFIKINNNYSIELINEFEMHLLEDGTYLIEDKYNYFNVQFKDNYYYIVFKTIDNTYDLFIYDFKQTLDESSVKSYLNLAIDINIRFENDYFIITNEDNVVVEYYYNGVRYSFEIEKNEDITYNFTYLNEGFFVEKAILLENQEDITSSTVKDLESGLYYNYEYSYFNFETEEFESIQLSDGYVKAEFSDLLDGKYLALYEQKLDGLYIDEIGKFIYYNFETFEPIISYDAKDKDNLILYTSSNSILTKDGIYKVKDGAISSTIYEFGEFEQVLTNNFVSDNFVLFNSSLNNSKIMNMKGEISIENTFISIKEYDDGNYICRDFEDCVYLINLKTLSTSLISNFVQDNINTSLAFVGFGAYFTSYDDGKVLKNYLGESLVENVKSYELVSLSSNMALKVVCDDDSIVYYIKEGVTFSDGNTESVSSYQSDKTIQLSTNNSKNNTISDGVDLYYSDTDAGTSITYYYNGIGSGDIELTNYSSYTYYYIDVYNGFWPDSGSIDSLGNADVLGIGNDSGFEWSLNRSEHTASYNFDGDTRWKDDNRDSNRDLGSSTYYHGQYMWFNLQYLAGPWNWTACGNFDSGDGAQNYMNVTPATFTITLNKQGGSGGTDSVTEIYANTAVPASITKPSKTGYSFGGYFLSTGGSGGQVYNADGNRIPASSLYFDSDDTIYAYWIGNKYTVEYDWNGGTKGSRAPTNATFGSTFNVDDPSRTGYTFTSWYLSGMDTCTHDIDGESSTATTYTLTDDSASYNYFMNLTSANGGKVKLKANWAENKYTITFNLNNPNSYTDDISTGYSNRTPDFTDSETINNPVKTGYTFTGWTITGMSTSPTCNHEYGSSTTADASISSTKATTYKKLHVGSQTASNNVVTFTANWTKNTYSIKYVLGTGGKFLNTSDDQPTSAKYDEVFHVTDPVKKGYTFSSWSITNASDKGAMNEEVIHNYGTTNSASSTFKGTSKASINVEYFKNLRHAGGEVTLTANWTKTTYTVTFNLNNPNSVTNDISSINNKTGTYDVCLSVSEIPTKTGYLFTHWSISGMDTSRYNEDTYHYHHETETTKDKMNVVKSQAEIGKTTSKKYMNLHSSGGTVTFKANWKPIQYTISYSANGGDFGSISNPTSKKYDEDLNVTNPLKHGYDFTGWTITSSKKALKPSYSSNSETYTTSHPKKYPNTRTDNFKNITISDGDTVTFTAQWTPAVYKIKFVYNNPTKDDETKTGYKYDTEYTIDNPKRMGYIFDYWTLSACSSCDVYDFTCKHKHGSTEFSGTSISNVTSTKFKNLHCVTDSVVTFTASWHAKTYYLINEAAGYGSTLEKQSVKYDEWFYITAPTSSPLGYHFSGWKVINMNKTDENTSEKVKHYYGANTSATTYKENVDTLTVATENAKYYFKNLSSNSEASVTIQPQWTANTYVVTFDMNNPNWFTNDITVKSDYTATYDTAFSVTDPTKTGYSFTGWSLMTLSDDCVHYFGTSTSACTTAFESLNGRYNQVTPSPNPNYLEVVKKTAFKNLRSDRASGIKAVMIANWKANKYTITYHYLPESFDVTAYELSQLNTHVNLVSQMTASHTQEVTYDKIFEATNYKRENGELIFGLPIGLRLITWGMVSGTPAGTTKTAKYNSSNVIVTNFTGKDAYNNTISADIYPYEEQIFGVGEKESDYTNWIYFTTAQINAGIHLYAAYDLAGINLRYYVPKTAAGSNFLQNYVNVENSVFGTTLAGLNTNKKYTEVVTLADNANIPNYQNLVGWMIVQTYDSSGELTKDSLTRYAYQSTTYVAYKGNEVHWGFTNVDAYSYEDPTYFLYAVYDEVYSGDFGDLTFTYNSTNNGFVVKGKGSSYVNGSVKIPAYYDNGTTGFKKVYQIGSEAFNGYTNLTSVHIPSTVVSIAYKAFYNCDKLASISLPSNLTTIDSYAFYDCDKIPSLTTPSTLKTIGGYAFYHCDKLATVTLNEGLTKIDDSYAFYYCPITSITIPSTLTFLGVGTFEWTKLTSITIPRSVQELRGSTFWYCQELTTVTFESNSSVSSIGSGVFAGCVKLTSISLPNSVKSIGGRAFELCSAMTSITMPDALTSLGESAFLGCAKLTSIVMPKGLTAINNKTFQDCVKLTSVKVYDGITSIGEYAFDNCAVMTSLTIPNTVTTIGKGAFRSMAKLASLSIPFVGQTRTATSNTYIGYMFGASKYENNGTSVPSTLKTLKITDASKIAVHALYGLSNLTSLTISNSVTEIGEDALAGTTALTTLSVPFIGKSRTDADYGYIGYWYDVANNTPIINYLPSLTTVNITGATAIYNYALFNIKSGGSPGTTLKTLTLNEGITSIGNRAFAGLGITTISIPASVTTIGDEAFSCCGSMAYVNFNEGLETISEKAFYACELLTSITVPSTVKTMGSYVFAYCVKLTSAVILDGTTTIGSNAFYCCRELTTVRLPKTITAIPNSMFSNCSKLATVHIQEGVTSIGTFAFSQTAITTIKLPTTLTTIGLGAFSHNTSLTSIVIPDSVTKMNGMEFMGCTALTKIVIPSGVTKLGGNTFAGCTSLARAEILGAVTMLSGSDFENCTALTTLIFHKPFGGTAENAFNNCSSLKYVYFGGTEAQWINCRDGKLHPTGNDALRNLTYGVSSSDGVICNYDKMVFTYTGSSYSIGGKGSVSDALVIPYYYDDGVNGKYVVDEIVNKAYYGHTSLTSVQTSNQIKIIGDSAFSGCTALTSCTFSTALTSIGSFAFYNCEKLTSATVPAAITVLNRYTFYGCKALTSLTFSSTNTLTKIDEHAVDYCIALTTIKIPTSVTFIGNYAFSSCYALNGELILPSGLTTLGRGAFYFNKVLDGVILPSTLKVIDELAFSNCYELGNVYIPDSVDTISAHKYDYAPFYNSYDNLMIFCEDIGKQAGWGQYWNYKNSSTMFWTFYDYAAGPAVKNTNRTGYSYNQATGKFTSTSSTSSKLEFTAIDFVNLRFEYKSDSYFDITLNGTSINYDHMNRPEYRDFYILLSPGQVLAIYHNSTKYITVNNLRFDAITSASNDYGFAADTSYNIYNSTYHIKSTNYHIGNSCSYFVLTANDDVTVDFKYLVGSTGVQWDYFQVNKNGTELLKAGGTSVTTYTKFSTISLIKGDVLEFKYYKNASADSGIDSAIIEDLRIKSKVYFIDDTDTSMNVRATSFDHTHFSVTTADGWEMPYKEIFVRKYNAELILKYRVYGNYTPLSGYSGVRIQVLNQAPPTGTDCYAYEVAGATLSCTEGVYFVRLVIPTPGRFYLAYNFGHMADGYTIEYDIGCVYRYGIDYARRYFSDFSSSGGNTQCNHASAFNSRVYISDEGYLTASNSRSTSYTTTSTTSMYFMDYTNKSYILTAPYSMLLTFEYYVRCESADDIYFYVNNTEVKNLYGDMGTSWYSYSIYLNKGDVFKISYDKDVSQEHYIDGYYIQKIEMTRIYGFVKTSTNVYVSENVGAQNSEAVMGFTYKSSGTLSFNYTLSSETYNDRLYVYVDGVCVHKSYALTSGTNGSFSRSISAGSLVKIVYVKDSTVNKNNDKVTITFTSKPY